MKDPRDMVAALDRIANDLEETWRDRGMTRQEAARLVDYLDTTAAVLERDEDEEFMDQFESMDVVERDEDEEFMDSYEENTLEHDDDEEYMDGFEQQSSQDDELLDRVVGRAMRRSEVIQSEPDDDDMLHYEDDVIERDDDEEYMEMMDDAGDERAVMEEHENPKPVRKSRSRSPAYRRPRRGQPRRSEVIESDPDEDYMMHFNDDVLKQEDDEEYMDHMDDAGDEGALQTEHHDPVPVEEDPEDIDHIEARRRRRNRFSR